MGIRAGLLTLAFVVVTRVFAHPDSAESFGRFIGNLTGTFTDQGWQFKLAEDLVYVDPSKNRWLAPRGSVVDGASIPRVFWTAVGGPFEGDYRNASAVHDVACVQRNKQWQDVHRMFYYAMRAGGVPLPKALLMYGAVYRFGPRWPEPQGFWGVVREGLKDIAGIFTRGEPGAPAPVPPRATEEDVKRLEVLIEENRPTTPEDVERLLAQ